MPRNSIIATLGLVIYGVLIWAFDHFLWDWFTTYLEVKWQLKEATLIASGLSYVIPLLIVLFCLMAIYWLERANVESANALQPQADFSINDALDYVVNDSTAKLNQPPKPYIAEFGPAKGRRVTHSGVEHEDARTKVNGKLISGDLTAWGYRQLLCHIANQFELSLRPIPTEYWDSYQLDPLSCLHHTKRQPQTVNLPGKPDVLHWTGIMLSKQQVQKLWPHHSHWQRLLRIFKRKPAIKARPDLFTV